MGDPSEFDSRSVLYVRIEVSLGFRRWIGGWKLRRAINLDPNCRWARGKADVLYIADAFVVLEKLIDLLAQRAARLEATVAMNS